MSTMRYRSTVLSCDTNSEAGGVTTDTSSCSSPYSPLSTPDSYCFSNRCTMNTCSWTKTPKSLSENLPNFIVVPHDLSHRRGSAVVSLDERRKSVITDAFSSHSQHSWNVTRLRFYSFCAALVSLALLSRFFQSHPFLSSSSHMSTEEQVNQLTVYMHTLASDLLNYERRTRILEEEEVELRTKIVSEELELEEC